MGNIVQNNIFKKHTEQFINEHYSLDLFTYVFSMYNEQP